MSEEESFSRLPIDEPIRSSDEDQLLRSPVAHEFARTVRELDAREGFVVGVLGPWGHGKSSFINLMREEFDRSPALAVVEFNPWMFSGSEQLVDFFFREIAAELHVKDKRFGKISDWLNQYGGILSGAANFIPIPGAGAAAKVAEGTLKGLSDSTRSESTAREMRDKLRQAMGDLERPIVVVIDDIDRLTKEEIREIFKLVRLTGSFPNLIYILAFDRARVEQALEEDGIPGRAYLEKIVQLGYDVPIISSGLLRSRTLDELNNVIGDLDDKFFDAERWSNIYYEVIEPLFKNMRDVTRFALSARSTVRALMREASVVDILAMEAIRVFRPEVYQHLSGMRSALTKIKERDGGDEKTKQRFKELFSLAGSDDELIKNLIKYAFPAGRQYYENQMYSIDFEYEWKRNHRLAHIDYLGLYLDRVAPSELEIFRKSERAYSYFESADELRKYLESIKPIELQDVIQGLEAYQDDFTMNAAVPAGTVLFNLIDSIPKRAPKHMFDIGRRDVTVTRIVLRLLRSIKDKDAREIAVSQILGKIETYSSTLELIEMVGYQEGIGHKLVREEYAKKLEEGFDERVSSTPPKYPEREWDALRVYYFVGRHEDESAPLAGVRRIPLLKAVLSAACSENISWSESGRKVEEVLQWDVLLKVFGGESSLKQAIERVRKVDPNFKALQLVDKYLGGWRPKR